jgi:hypothetical protein
MLFICSHEDHSRRVFLWQGPQNIKTVHAWHLYVKKYQVRPNLSTCLSLQQEMFDVNATSSNSERAHADNDIDFGVPSLQVIDGDLLFSYSLD